MRDSAILLIYLLCPMLISDIKSGNIDHLQGGELKVGFFSPPKAIDGTVMRIHIFKLTLHEELCQTKILFFPLEENELVLF